MKYLVLSDIHLGHRVNKTENIYKNIISFFNHYHHVLKDIKVLFLAGDVFDSFLSSYSEDYLISTHFLTYIVNWCKDKNVKLRILEGTPSHDWRQARVISSIIKDLKISIDYKYIDTLLIEKMEDLNVSVLYIPDEYKHKGIEVQRDVEKLLKENSLTKVDIAIMHGQFNYQIPMIKLESSHDEDYYLSIVKHYINIGHIHTHSTKDRILAQGSFDRLAHNEEEDKGGILVNLDLNNPSKDEWFFLKNKHAMIFKTFDLSKEDDITSEIKSKITSLPIGSSVRFIVKDKDKFIIKLQELKKIVKNYNIKIMVPDVKVLSKGDSILKDDKIIAFSITKDNILDLVKDELEKVKQLDKIKVDKSIEILKKYI